MTTVVYRITAPDPLEVIRTAWESEARGLAMLGCSPDDSRPRQRGQRIYRVRVPAARPDGLIVPIGIAEEVTP